MTSFLFMIVNDYILRWQRKATCVEKEIEISRTPNQF